MLATDYVKTGNRAAAAGVGQGLGAAHGHAPGLVHQVRPAAGAEREWLAEAIEILERVKRTSPPSYELAFNLAGVYLLKNDPVAALESYDQALVLNPTSVPALRQAAGIAEQQGELERSLSYWIRAKKIEPDNPEILFGFGRVCLKMDLLDDAEPALTKAASLRPGRSLLPVRSGCGQGREAPVPGCRGLCSRTLLR